MNDKERFFTPRDTLKLLKEILRSDANLNGDMDPATGTGGFLHALANMLEDKERHFIEHIPYSYLAEQSLNKLDGVWSVQLLFRTWPYYFRRSNSAGEDPLTEYNIVMSEKLPLPNLPEEAEYLWNIYMEQVWAMSAVYIEAILEHYFFELIKVFGYSKGKVPRQAFGQLRYLREHFKKDYGYYISIEDRDLWQLGEINATRHLWVHLNGIVDDTYIKDARNWWESRPEDWFETKPKIGEKRSLSEPYIKSSIYHAKKLVRLLEDEISPYVDRTLF